MNHHAPVRAASGGADGRVLLVGLAGFFLLFMVAPVATVFIRAAGHDAVGAGGLDAFWSALTSIVTAPRTRSVITFTVGQASLSAALAVAVALPGAYLMAHYTFPGRRIIYSLSLLPLCSRRSSSWLP